MGAKLRAPGRIAPAPGWDEQGSASVYIAGVIIALVTLFVLISGIVGTRAQQLQAQVAADMAATSSAARLFEVGDKDTACALAAEIAMRNRATLLDCTAAGGDVQVRVRNGRATAVARAGDSAAG